MKYIQRDANNNVNAITDQPVQTLPEGRYQDAVADDAVIEIPPVTNNTPPPARE